MPELPEMETYRRILSEKIAGKRIHAVTVTREKSINVPVEEFIKEVQGRTIISIERRAKHLIFKLDSGKNLLLHLMLGGLMYVGTAENDLDRTKQVTLSFDHLLLFFIGLRLGYLHLLTNERIQEELIDLGLEPLSPEFTLDRFIELIEKRRGVLKTALVNQKFLSGIGNLYSDEICFEAGLLPTRQANELNQEETTALYQAIQTILKRGIELGGYMDVPIYNGDQLTGRYRDHCYVYDREGESCKRCGAVIIRDEISSRKSFYCSQCQK
ncbi:formamidopyrimidine-DNA glycosylase [Bacillus sp. SA1-12]|uniref:bifunctional DNA-formamidopyrimidine glycosylase/DNA-(apurinic or apyrimidinic site) lyase n=1 Tax=Bacillus sp. SA1-12 TaxID=1455638 RepID=UPI000626F9F1|nr:bifunctional DNA-formamidopyrimidine glycosylase/DNA-(apurinic or apyrimidinic site) lyase [Bacillus sp. SA1-12]KKI89010.1 formamidopyrimidine-DNA glycosylase [Bacillus sp. SA1-12]